MAEWWEQDTIEAAPLQSTPTTNWWEQDAALIENTGQSQLSSMVGSAGQGVLAVPGGVVGGIGALGEIVGLEDNALQRAGEAVRQFGQEYSPVNPIYAQSFPVEAAGAVGQAAGQLATLPVGGLAGRAIAGAAGVARGAQIAGLGSGALMGAQAGQETADRLGIENRAQRAALILGQAGIELGTEMLGGFGTKEFTQGILGLADSMPWKQSLVRTALTEGGEEAIAGTAQPLLERGVLLGQEAPSGVELTGIPLTSVDATLDVLKQGALGAVAGGFMGGVQAVLNRPEPQGVLNFRLRAKARINELEKAPQLTEEEQAELAQLQTEDQNAAQWLQDYGEQNVYEPLRQVINPTSEWRNQRESLIADTEDQAGKQNLRRQTDEEIKAATEVLERAGNPFSAEATDSALNEALTPPDAATEASILQAAADPAIAATQAVAEETASAGAPATAAALQEQADLKAAQNILALEQEPLNILQQDETQTTLTEDVGQPIPLGGNIREVVQGQEVTGIAGRRGASAAEGVGRVREMGAGDEGVLQDSPLEEVIPQGAGMAESFLTPASEAQPIEAQPNAFQEAPREGEAQGQEAAFEQALRNETKDLPKWTDARIVEAVEWFKGGREGPPPWGVGPVNRAVLVVDQEERRAWQRKEQELLARFKKADVQDQLDVDDIASKAQIERQEQLNEIPAEELSYSMSNSSLPTEGLSNRELAREVRNLRADFNLFKQSYRDQLEPFQNRYRELSVQTNAQQAWRTIEQENPEGAALYDRFLQRAANLSRFEAEMEARGLNPDEQVPEELKDYVPPKPKAEPNKPLKKGAAKGIQQVWEAISQTEESFRGKKSTAKDANNLAQEMSGGRVTAYEDLDGSIVFRGPSGQISIESPDTARPYIFALSAQSEGKAQGGGSLLYQIAFAWAHNNNKKIYPSNNLTSINAYVRRTSNMLSSALRYGTTKHMIPDKDQRVSGWKTGDDKGNIARLAWREAQQVLKAIPEIENVNYDFQTGEFYTQTKETLPTTPEQTQDVARLEQDTQTPATASRRRNLSPQDLEKIVSESLDGGYGNELGIGETTLKRAIITLSAAREQDQQISARPEAILYSRASDEYGVSRQDAQEALAKLNSSSVGRSLVKDVVIADNLDNLREVTVNNPLPPEAYSLLRNTEGFFRPSTGESYIILNNVSRLNGETPEQAIRRIIFHERAFHGGLRWMMLNDPEFKMRISELADILPQSEKDRFADYPGVNGNPITLLEEWMASKFQQGDPEELSKQDPFFKRVWHEIKAFISRVLGWPINSRYVEAEARKLLGDILRSRQAFNNQRMNVNEDLVVRAEEPTAEEEELNYSYPFSQREADASIEQVKQEAGFAPDAPDAMVNLHQFMGNATDQAYVVQTIRPQAEFVRSRIWTGGVDENGQPIVNEENTRSFWRENDRMTSDPEWAGRLQDDFREGVRQSTDPQVRANRAEAIGSIAQLELANYAQLMAASDVVDAPQAIDAIRRGRFYNDTTLLRYASIAGAARALNARALASRKGMMGFWSALGILEDKKEKAVNNTVGKGNVDRIQRQVNNPDSSDLPDGNNELPDLPNVEPPSPDQLLGLDESSIVNWRTELEKDGVDRLVDGFFRGGEQRTSQAGPLIQGSNWLNQTLSQIMNDQLDAMGIQKAEGQPQPGVRERIIRELGLGDLRAGKIIEFDNRLRERINEYAEENPLFGQQLLSQWEQISSAIRNTTVSGATSRRAIYEVLNERKRRNQANPPPSPQEITTIREIATLPAGAKAEAMKRLLDEIVEGIRQQSRMEDLQGNETFISPTRLEGARKSLSAALDYLLQQDRVRAAKSAQARLERQKAEDAGRPTREAQAIIDKIDEGRTDWIGPSQNKSKVKALKEEALSSQLTDRSRPGFLTQDQFIQRYTQAFEALGVNPSAAINLSSRLYDENIRLRANQFLREMDSNVRNAGTKGLVDVLLNEPRNIFQDPQLRQEKMVEFLKETGLTHEQAERWSKRHEGEFMKKLNLAREKAFDKAIKGVSTLKQPSVDKIRQAIRAGNLDPFTGVRDAIAEALGAKGLTREDFKKMAEADLRMRDAGPTEFHIHLSKIRDILQSKSPDTTTGQRILQSYIQSVLSGLSAQSLGFTVPFFTNMTRLGLGLGDTIIAAARGVMPKSEVPTAIMASVNDYVEAYKSWVSAFSTTWKNDITTIHHQENLNYINSLREDLRRQLDKFKNGTLKEKLRSIIPIAQSSTDIVRRVMNAADGASLAVFRQVFTRQGARKILGSGPKRLSTSQIGLIFQESQNAGKEAAEEAFSKKGYTETEAQQIGFDRMNEFIYEFISAHYSATDADQLRDYAQKETAYELGIAPPSGGRDKVPAGDVFAHVAAMIQSASNYMSRESPLLGRMLLGFVSIPTSLANRSLHYTPYGLARYFAKAMELKRGSDELYLNSMGSELQRRQRLVEGVAGTTAMLILGMLAYAGSGEDDENYTGLRVSGSGPKDPALRDAWLKTGQRPNSFSWMINGKVVASIPFGRGGFESIKLAAVGIAAMDDLRLNNEIQQGSSLELVGDWAKSALVGGLDATSYFGLKSIANAVSLGDSRATEASVFSQAAWTTSGMVPWSGLIKSITRPFVGPLDVSSAKASVSAQFPVINAIYGQPARNFLGDVKGAQPVDLFTRASDRLSLTGMPIYLAIDPSSTSGRAYELFVSKGNAPSVPSRSRLTSEFGGVTDQQWGLYVRVRGDIIKRQVFRRYAELRRMDRAAFGDALSAISTAATREAKKALRLT